MSLVPFHTYKEWYYLSKRYKPKEPDKKYHLKLTEEYFDVSKMNTMDIMWFRDKDKDTYLTLRKLKQESNNKRYRNIKLPKIIDSCKKKKID